MLLQIAVGPVCLFIFSQAGRQGFWPAFAGAWAVTAADGIYILAALFGFNRRLRLERWKPALRRLGAAAIAGFGLVILLDAWTTVAGMPDAPMVSGVSGVAMAAFLLTLSNPVTLVFWVGLFAVKAAADGLGQRGLMSYALGALTATPAFLIPVACIGAAAHSALPLSAIRILNILGGLAIIGFGLRSLINGDRKGNLLTE